MSAGALVPTEMPSTRAPDLSGIALDGRYELLALIGEGSFGRVYRGRDRRLARQVAVKVIKPWWAEDPDWVRSFEREAQLLASISDPGIVQIFDVGSAPEGLYYVAELVEGESLAARLRRGRPSVAEARGIAEQLAQALASAHARRVIHRDVKPANVLISADGRIKVGDFGVARLAEGSTDGGPATIVGTPSYMAPEQARTGVSTTATDVYSVGIVLYEMLAGRPPFSGHSPVELAIQHLQDPPPALPPARRRRIALLCGAVLLAAGMGITALALTSGHTTVPNLHGMTRSRIRATVARGHLHAAFRHRYSSKARTGIAIGQSPKAGIRVSTGTTVRVVLSAGPPPVEVPRVVGQSANSARIVLGDLKLKSSATEVPAPGAATGTVTRQDPAAGRHVPVGTTVALSVAEPPQLRSLTSFSGDRSVPFRIRGRRWEIFYSMAYDGTCQFIFWCSGPSATVTNVSTGAKVDQFDLGEGDNQTRIVHAGAGIYQISVSAGSDGAHWSFKVDDYY
jgi:serine/threonine-protein kinase